jgi:hypothetical protein
MLAQLAEAAIRSFALGVVAWLGITILCVCNPQIRMTIWTVVLAVSVAMPALTPWMKLLVHSRVWRLVIARGAQAFDNPSNLSPKVFSAFGRF